jgi:hypothetical protein
VQEKNALKEVPLKLIAQQEPTKIKSNKEYVEPALKGTSAYQKQLTSV